METKEILSKVFKRLMEMRSYNVNMREWQIVLVEDKLREVLKEIQKSANNKES